MLLLVALALLLVPSAAHAHAKLIRSNPAAGAHLASSPTAIRLAFSEKPEISLSLVRLIRASGDTVDIGPLRSDPGDDHALLADIVAPIPAGAYRIHWRVSASDGHVTRGTVGFTIVAPATAAGTQNDTGTAGISPFATEEHDMQTMAVAGALGSIVARWISFISLFLVIGAVTFRFVVLRKMAPGAGDSFTHIASTNSATLGLVAAAGALLAAVVKLGRESADMPDVALGSMLFGSKWGWSLIFQMIAALVAAFAFLAILKAREDNKDVWWVIAFGAAALLAASPALGGHAAAYDRAWLAVPSDIVHVAVGAMWLGTLAVVLIVGVSAALKTPDAVRPGARVAKMINAFSPLALVSGGAVAATGIGSSVLHLPTLRALWTTPYGLALMLKLVFVGLMFAAGAWNWRRMKPRLTGDDSVAPLRSTASLELVLGLAVLGVTAVLVALELP